MEPQSDNRRFLLWLVLTTLGLGVVLAVTAVVSLRQSASVEATARLQADSVTALTFQTEREFLRFRQALQLALPQGPAGNWGEVTTRLELLASRVLLLRDNPSTLRLRPVPEYRDVLPRLERLVQEIDPLLRTPMAQQAALQVWSRHMTDLGPDVQALSFAANRLVSRLVEDQVAVARQQNRLIGGLLAGQALMLLLATAALLSRHRRLQRERLALERANTELAHATEVADRANRATGQFLANMSHELRTPFNGMLGMMDLLEDSGLNPGQREQLHTARHSAEHLLHLLNDILDLSALDAGKVSIHTEPVDLPGLVRSACQLMQAQADKQGLRLALHTDAAEAGPVLADPTRVRQVVLNLLNNAIKFTPAGRIDLDLHGEAGPAGQVHWRITVSDSGVGMDAATLAQLFQRFHRVDDSATRRFGGTGLGLEISRTLARLMGGDITVQSTPGAGSAFTFSLTTQGCAAVPPPEPPLPTGPDTLTPPPCWRVLVAEDHPVNRRLLALLLDKLGHNPTFADHGGQALALAAAQDFDVVLMDLHMPAMDGLEATRHIRALSGRRGQVPIVALSADVLTDTQERARAAGMSAYLAKPFSPDRLQQVMAQCVTSRSAASG